MTHYTVSATGAGAPLTVTEALARAVRGDVLVFRKGDYDTTITIGPNKVGITLEGNGASVDGIRVFGHHITIEDFDVSGSGSSGVGIYNTHHVTVQDVRSHGNKLGFYAYQSDEILFDNVEGDHNQDAGISIHVPKSHGPNEAGYDIIVRDSSFHHNVQPGGKAAKEGWGAIADGVGKDGLRWTYNKSTLFEDCDFYANGKGGFLAHFAKTLALVDNDAWGNFTSDKARGGFEFGFRASQTVALLRNEGVSDGSSKADDAFFWWEGSSTGVVRGNRSCLTGYQGHLGVDVRDSPAVNLAPTLNHWGDAPDWHEPGVIAADLQFIL